MKRLTMILGIGTVLACGPQAGSPDEIPATDSGGGDDGDDDGGLSASGAAATTDAPRPETTADLPGASSTGFDATTGGTSLVETGRLPCHEQTTIEGCRDASCMATVVRRWNSTPIGVCRGPEELFACSGHIACFMPDFACPLFAAEYTLEIIEGCLPADHEECNAPGVPAPPCP